MQILAALYAQRNHPDDMKRASNLLKKIHYNDPHGHIEKAAQL